MPHTTIDLTTLWSAKDEPGFPYRLRSVCYLEVTDGAIHQRRTLDDLRAAAQRATAGDSQIIAIWSTPWRADAFHVDAPEQLAAALLGTIPP